MASKGFTCFDEAWCIDSQGSEWIAAVKLIINYANLAGVREAKSKNPWNHLCRHCGCERETPSHFLGACDFGKKQRIARRHRVKHRLNSLLTSNGCNETRKNCGLETTLLNSQPATNLRLAAYASLDDYRRLIVTC